MPWCWFLKLEHAHGNELWVAHTEVARGKLLRGRSEIDHLGRSASCFATRVHVVGIAGIRKIK